MIDIPDTDNPNLGHVPVVRIIPDDLPETARWDEYLTGFNSDPQISSAVVYPVSHAQNMTPDELEQELAKIRDNVYSTQLYLPLYIILPHTDKVELAADMINNLRRWYNNTLRKE